MSVQTFSEPDQASYNKAFDDEWRKDVETWIRTLRVQYHLTSEEVEAVKAWKLGAVGPWPKPVPFPSLIPLERTHRVEWYFLTGPGHPMADGEPTGVALEAMQKIRSIDSDEAKVEALTFWSTMRV